MADDIGNTDIPAGDSAESDLPAKPSKYAGQIPNGGVAAWLQVLGGFFLFFNSW